MRILHEAGVPPEALKLVIGDGKIGAALVSDRHTAGVAFTGSTEVARAINRVLAGKDQAIVPLIAETGGINPMIVDATALPEQVTDDVVTSAFRSAGQRCSALRLLCVQEDVADRVIEMVAGAARELKLGDPADPATHVGPVIDAEARQKLDRWIAAMERQGRVRFRWDAFKPLPDGLFVPPTIIALDRARDLKEEVFGPILHVVRWRADALDALLDDIAANGYALTFGIHSRIDDTVEKIVARDPAWQCLRQPQHHRRGGRHAAVRRHAVVRHRAEGRRPELPAPLRHRADRDDQHRGGRRQRQPADGGGVMSAIRLRGRLRSARRRRSASGRASIRSRA